MTNVHLYFFLASIIHMSMISINMSIEPGMMSAISAAQVRADLHRKGISRHDLATLTGMAVQSVNNVLVGLPRARGRAAIERAMGTAFWTEVEEFNRRTLIHTRFGVDPALVSTARLRSLLAELDVPGRSGAKTKKDLIALLARHAGYRRSNLVPRKTNRSRGHDKEGTEAAQRL